MIKVPAVEEDYEPFEYNVAHMGEKFNLGVHNEAFKKVATRVAKKERFDTDQEAWTKPFWYIIWIEAEIESPNINCNNKLTVII